MDKIQIGNCTLIHGDCLEIMSSVGSIDSVVTDPPYGMNFQSNYRDIKHSLIANDDSADCLSAACAIDATHSKYIFCRWDNLREIQKPKSVITWIKNNWSMGDLKHEHARQTELICFFQGRNHFWPDARPTDIVYSARSGNVNHPTEKPVCLMERIILWTDGTVLDPFMGSGATGVACVNLDRSFIGIEIDKGYFDIACERIAKAVDDRASMLF